VAETPRPIDRFRFAQLDIQTKRVLPVLLADLRPKIWPKSIVMHIDRNHVSGAVIDQTMDQVSPVLTPHLHPGYG
jgi:hypothetical protein